MLKIFKIAKLEISILFYSPVAWLVLAIFIVQSGIGFFGMFQGFQEALSMGIGINNLTFSIFPGLNGLFDKVLQTLYLYIPLLTMGLMSREISSGSIKLLLSSPVNISQIILGKYLAMVLYGFLLILVLASYSLLGVVIIKDADVLLILSGLTGLFLLVCTYAALGLFMSSLTAYQVVAAISTLAVFAALQFVGTIGQDIDFVRDITYFLSISGRTEDMLKGLLTTRDVIYFIIIIVLFLSLCIFRLQAGRNSGSAIIQVGKYALLISCALLAGYISSRPAFTGYKDMTATHSRTLTENSQLVLRQLDGPLKITTYVNLLDENVYSGLPAARNADHAMFEEYQRFIPGLKMEYVYYYDITDLKVNSNMIYQGDMTGLNTKQIAEKIAENMGLDIDMFMPPSEIRKMIDLGPEDNNFVRILEYKGKTSKLRVYNEMNRFPGEAEITAAIKRLIIPAPKVGFLSGNNERSIDKKGDRNYQMISTARKYRSALINQGFDVISIDPETIEIPDSLSVLVLADPTVPLSERAFKKIINYLDKGGNTMITGEPGRQALLNPLLRHLGISLLDGMLVNPTKDYTPDKISGIFSLHYITNDPAFEHLQLNRDAIILQTSAGLSYDSMAGFKVDTLLQSPFSGWNKRGAIDLTSTDVSFNPSAGDKKGPFPIMLSLKRIKDRRTQEILVSGDADFMSNIEILQPKGANKQVVSSIFSWFSNRAFPIDVSRETKPDDDILVTRRQLAKIKMIFLGAIPAVIIGLGAFVLMKRKRL